MTRRPRQEIIAEIEALATEPGYLYALAFLIRAHLFYDPAEATEIDWRARLSYQEFTFVAGLLVKKTIDLKHPTEEQFLRHAHRTYELFDELHQAHGADIIDRMLESLGTSGSAASTAEANARAFFGSGAVITESIFYSGSGAYDFQYWTLAPARYRFDEEWIRANVGLTIRQAADLTSAIKSEGRSALQNPPETFSAFVDAVLDMFCVDRAWLAEQSSEEVADAFTTQFSLEPGSANADLREPGQFNELDARPLIHLGHGRYFIAVHFNLARSIYESPFYWMLQDAGYASTASRNRGDTTEEVTEQMLRNVFGENVWRRVVLKRGSHRVGDIDVLATLGEKALIVQCKSKRLTELARRGNQDKIEDDFRLAVQDAYDQGLRCRELLTDASVRAETESGARIDINLDDAFICCVLSDHYPSLAHQVNTFLRREDHEPWPLAISVFDLELFCHYLSNPFDFFYYVRQRTRLADHFRSDEEISLLAYHLKQKLWVSPAIDIVSVAADYAQLIDANYPAVAGIHPRTEASDRLFHEWKNEHFDQLVDDLQSSGEPGFVDAVFLLYDFSGDAIDDMFAEMLRAKAETRRDGKKHSMATMSEEADAGISFVTRESDARRLAEDSLLYARLKKYQQRAGQWLALASLGDSPRLAEFVAYSREPWAFDAALEAEVVQLLGRGVARRLGTKIGRNDPCFCGSGLKFKRCHGR